MGLTTCMMETGYFLFEYEGYPVVGKKAAGDIGGEGWVRYDDPATKSFKLNVERQNGRAAMLGITGCLIHELLGVDALYPTGGLGGAAPPPIVAALAVQGRVAPAMNALAAVARSSEVTMFSEGNLGVLPPLGVYDPLGLIETRDMGRYQVMEIKHGRAAMLGFLHVVVVEAGIKIPTEECLAAPTGCFASLEAVPTAGWLQIMLTMCMIETGGYAGINPTSELGDIAGIPWVRYDDPEVKTFKLNAERQNGRAAMMGITGCLLHEIFGVDALYPTGGMDNTGPLATIF